MSRTPLDTVEHAAATPDVELPWAELGLKKDEYERVVEILGRRPTGAELAMYSVMWSEHCSYKSSKVHLRQFGEKAPQSDAMLVGIGENAGVVDVGQGYAVTFKGLGRPTGAAAKKGQLGQVPETDLAYDLSGVEADWRPAQRVRTGR